jgi:hypothetical protein
MIDNIREVDKERDVQIKKWFEHGEDMDGSESARINNAISFFTGQLLLDIAQGIYFLNKVVDERHKFSIGQGASKQLFFEHACTICEMEFNEDKWKAIVERPGFN